MAMIKGFNPNITYISDRLIKKLNTLIEAPVTIIEAPTGYGKTTAVKEYIKNENIPTLWFNIYDNNRERFFEEICENIKTISEDACHKLLTIGFPKDKKECFKIAETLMNIDIHDTTLLVFDNYQNLSDELSDEILVSLAGFEKSKIKIVYITQAINSRVTLELVMKKKLNYLDKSDFELTCDEIKEYYKASGIKLTNDEAYFLSQYTEGWISALYLQLLSYATTNSFESTVNIDNLVSKAIWGNLETNEQDFLVAMSVFDSFSIRQAIHIYPEFKERDILNLIEKTGFFKYDSKTKHYLMHSILKYYIENEFDKLESVFKKKIYLNAGNWYRDNEDYNAAIKYYHHIKDYDSILNMDYSIDIFCGLGRKPDKQIVLDVIEKTPYEVKLKYFKTYFIYVFYLFLYNKKDMFKLECDNIEKILEDENYDNPYKNNLMGDLYFLKTLSVFNDLDKMYEYSKISFDYLKKPTELALMNGSSSFMCPSILALYHRETGKLMSEVEALDNYKPLYYKLTDGLGKGEEALMRAEMLFYQADFADAEKLCNKAIYMAESRGDISVYIATQFLNARIAFFNADYTKLENMLKDVNDKLEATGRYDLSPMLDISAGYIYSTLELPDSIPGWLTSNETIETTCSIYNMGFANIVYAKYLILNERYDEFLSIVGQMQSVANIYSNVIYKIYLCIFMAIVKIITHDTNKAKSFLIEALDLADKDSIYIPFVENYAQLIPIIAYIEQNSEHIDFINQVKSIARKYGKGFKLVMKASKTDKSYGLTNRELEVAKLAAKRLSNKEIADTLFIAESTVKSNLKVIFSKLNIKSRNDLKTFFE